jgi:hypothetical protein
VKPYDQSAADKFLTAVRAGASNDVAAAHAGLDVRDVREWLRGPTPETILFRRDVDKARADLELLAVGTVRRHMVDNPELSERMAERVRSEAEFERLRELTT